MIARAAMALALVGCGGGASTLKLAQPTRAVDESWIVDRVTTVKNQVEVEPGSVIENSAVAHRRSHRKVAILEGALIVRLAARYELDELSDGAGAKVDGPLAGKHYEIWRNADALEAQHADGSPITSVERAELTKEFETLGTTSRFDGLVRDRTWRRGETVEIPDDAARELPDIVDDADLREATLTWTGGDGDATTFRAKISFVNEDGFELSQTVDFRYDARTGRALGSTTRRIIRGGLGGHKVEVHAEIVETIE